MCAAAAPLQTFEGRYTSFLRSGRGRAPRNSTRRNAMAVVTKAQEKPQEKSQDGARPALSSKARALMEELNADASKSHVWVRTQMNAPAQRPWFTDTGGKTGMGEMASGRVAANQMKSAPYRWRWKEYNQFLERIAGI